MARPRKVDTAAMLKIVNDSYEQHGDGSQLKCSLLAEHAARHGIDVKAYDFRRNPAVRARINELRDSTFIHNGQPVVYKGLDVDAFINRNRGCDALKKALVELDGAWRKIHERACILLKERDSLSLESSNAKQRSEQLDVEIENLSQQATLIKKENAEMVMKNRYLVNTIKRYLYPAIANEILRNEGSMDTVDTEVSPVAMEELAEAGMPVSFAESVEADKTLSREESLLMRMSEIINGGEAL